MIQLILYGTIGCHLCEEAEALLAQAIRQSSAVSYAYADIADDAVLLERYGVRIPVLLSVATGHELGWPFDALKLRQFLQSIA